MNDRTVHDAGMDFTSRPHAFHRTTLEHTGEYQAIHDVPEKRDESVHLSDFRNDMGA